MGVSGPCTYRVDYPAESALPSRNRSSTRDGCMSRGICFCLNFAILPLSRPYYSLLCCLMVVSFTLPPENWSLDGEVSLLQSFPSLSLHVGFPFVVGYRETSPIYSHPVRYEVEDLYL